MHKFWIKIRNVNEKLILPAVIILMFIIIYELFLHIENPTLETIIHIVDYIIISIFVIDLIFLGIKAKNVKFFFQNYWLDILAVFPFSLFINTIGRFVILFSETGKSISVGQAIVHESLEISKVATKTEKLAKVGKSVRIGARIVRIISKSRKHLHFPRRKLKHVRVKHHHN